MRPGCPHDLVIIYKGFEQEADLAAARTTFSGLSHAEIRVGDEHFDIGSYLNAAAQVEADYVCCVNTHTQILAPHWLRHLRSAMTDPTIGLAGPHASFESLYDSLGITSKAVWLSGVEIVPYDQKLADYFRFVVAVHAPNFLTGKPTWRGWLPEYRYRRLEAKWDAFWRSNCQPGSVYDFLEGFPRFPNPHIRSNGFMLERKTLLNFFPLIEPTKKAAYGFESGPESLPAKILSSGRRLALVDRNGVVYDQDRWPESNTFRLGTQENIMIGDNQTRSFDALSKQERATHVMMTWGDSLANPPKAYPLGYRFRMRRG